MIGDLLGASKLDLDHSNAHYVGKSGKCLIIIIYNGVEIEKFFSIARFYNLSIMS
jgi:hypothetical protein